MDKDDVNDTRDDATRLPPPLTIQGKENQMINLAMDLAEKQLREGTASSQTINHFLQLGCVRESLKREQLEEEIKLLRAKTKALEEEADRKQLYADAIKAFQIYNGSSEVEDEYEDEYED